MQFLYTEPRSPKAAKYLAARAAHLATLNEPGQRAYLIGAVVAAQQLPLDAECDAFDRSLVVTTIRCWLEQVSETEAA